MKYATAVLAALAFSAPALAQNQTPPMAQPMQAQPAMGSVTKDDFVTGATSGGMYEVEASQFILQHTQNDEVKQLAQMLVDDHTKAGEELAAIVKAEGGTPPTTMQPKETDLLTQLKQVSADAVDSTYIEQQLAAHNEAIALFTSYSQSGDDQQLKAFATKTLPTLQHHLQMVQQLKNNG